MENLDVIDYLVFVLVLMVSAGIGVYYRFTGGKQSTLKEYVFADRSMSPWPVACSLMASFMSAVTLLGVSSENYNYGTLFQLINISYVIATPIVCYVFLPVFYNRGSPSVYEYLEERFGRATRLAASVAFTLQMVLYNGIVLYAPSLALSAVTGLDKQLAVLSIGIVCTFYSTIGGIKAVLITDVFQSVLMFAAVYIVIIHGITSLGFAEVFIRADEGSRIDFLNFELDPTVRHTFWSQIFGGMCTYLSLYAVNQAQVQRLMTVRNLETSRLSLWISLPILIVLSFSTAWAGITIYAQYRGCDPVLEGRIAQPDQILPLYVVDFMSDYKGITGLFTAGLLSGSLSTLSSSINSLAAVTLEDYIKPCLNKSLSPTRSTILTKCLALLFGVLSVGMSFVAEHMKGVLQASLTIFGVVGGPLLGLFTLGMLVPVASEKSSLPAFILSLALGLWIGFGGPKPPIEKLPLTTNMCDASFNSTVASVDAVTAAFMSANSTIMESEEQHYFYLYRLSYMWYTFIGFCVTVILGILLSLAYPETKKLDHSLLSPILKRVLKRERSGSQVRTGTNHVHANTYLDCNDSLDNLTVQDTLKTYSSYSLVCHTD